MLLFRKSWLSWKTGSCFFHQNPRLGGLRECWANFPIYVFLSQQRAAQVCALKYALVQGMTWLHDPGPAAGLPCVYFFICKVGIRTCIHELLWKVTIWLLVSTGQSLRGSRVNTTPFSPHSQYFSCSAGVWWSLAGLCPGNMADWWQWNSTGNAGGWDCLLLCLPADELMASLLK